MLEKVSIAEFIELALCCPDEQAMLILGDFGIGKTQVVKKIGTILGLDVIVFDCTHLNDPGDILGLPSIINGRTIFNPTYWYHPEKPVLLFFDEVFRATPEVRAALMTLCLDQTIGDKKLAPGSRVFAAANPPGFHGYEGEIPDPAQLSRYAPYWLDPTFNEWCEYAKEAKVHPAILEYLNNNKKDLDAYSAASDMNVAADDGNGADLKILQCRRSWFKASDNLYKAEKVKKVKKLDRNLVIRIMSGYIPATMAVKFAQTYMNTSTSSLNAEDVLNDWKKVKPADGAKLDVPTAAKLAGDIKLIVKETMKEKGSIPKKWKNNFSGFIQEGLTKESQVAVINNLIFQDMTNNEDWVFWISDDELQSFFETTVASKVA